MFPSFSDLFASADAVGMQMKGRTKWPRRKAEQNATAREERAQKQENVMGLQNETTAMERIKVPATPLVSSRIALGTWAMGGWMWGGTDEARIDPHNPRGARSRHYADRYRAGLRFRPLRGNRRPSAG